MKNDLNDYGKHFLYGRSASFNVATSFLNYEPSENKEDKTQTNLLGFVNLKSPINRRNSTIYNLGMWNAYKKEGKCGDNATFTALNYAKIDENGELVREEKIFGSKEELLRGLCVSRDTLVNWFSCRYAGLLIEREGNVPDNEGDNEGTMIDNMRPYIYLACMQLGFRPFASDKMLSHRI